MWVVTWEELSLMCVGPWKCPIFHYISIVIYNPYPALYYISLTFSPFIVKNIISISWLIITVSFVFLMIEDDWITFYQWRFSSKDRWFRCYRIKLHCCKYDGVVSCCRHEGIVMLQNHSYRFVFQLLQDRRRLCCRIIVVCCCRFGTSLQVRWIAANLIFVVTWSWLCHYSTDHFVMPQYHLAMPRDHYVILQDQPVVNWRSNQRGLVASYHEPFDSVVLRDEWTVWVVDPFLETWVV